MPTKPPPQADAAISLSTQTLTCLGCSALAVLIIYRFHDKPLAAIALPAPLWAQCLAGLGLAGAAALASYISFRLSQQGTATRETIASYRRLDLNGLNPVWISLAAAIGEELLFRAALQPLLGIWLASLVFLLAHVRAYKFRSLNRTVLVQAAGVFATSMCLGLIFEYIGLVAATLVHAGVDIAGLYTIRYVMRSSGT
jgi:membrane protease YdiL (CAAX protease family)